MSARLCSEPGCDKVATARGLCSTHYQRQRRAEGQTPGQVGRPRDYAPEVSDKNDGAPKLTVRLEPELMEWVRQQGGARWLRHATRELRRFSENEDFEVWWKLLSVNADSG